MKFRTIKRHFREAIKNIFRNGWMTIASVGAVTTTLILVGAFLALVFNLNQMANEIEDDVEIKVLINLTANEDQIKTLGDKITALDRIDSVDFSSKNEQLESLIESMGDEGQSWKLFQQDNPLNHAYVIKTKQPKDTEADRKSVV